jgi:hypothetical protein
MYLTKYKLMKKSLKICVADYVGAKTSPINKPKPVYEIELAFEFVQREIVAISRGRAPNNSIIKLFSSAFRAFGNTLIAH